MIPSRTRDDVYADEPTDPWAEPPRARVNLGFVSYDPKLPDRFRPNLERGNRLALHEALYGPVEEKPGDPVQPPPPAGPGAPAARPADDTFPTIDQIIALDAQRQAPHGAPPAPAKPAASPPVQHTQPTRTPAQPRPAPPAQTSRVSPDRGAVQRPMGIADAARASGRGILPWIAPLSPVAAGWNAALQEANKTPSPLAQFSDPPNPARSGDDGVAAQKAVQPSTGWRIGGPSMVEETGYLPGHEREAAGRIGYNPSDPGGMSYGAPQFASKKGQVAKFLKDEGAPWASEFAGLDPTKPKGAFAVKWREVAARDPAFYAAQHNQIQKRFYDPAVRAIAAQTGLDIAARSHGLQDAVWSTVIQHGVGKDIVLEAMKRLDGRISPSQPGYDRALAGAIYDVRSDYASGKIEIARRHMNNLKLKHRYERERHAVLAEIDSE